MKAVRVFRHVACEGPGYLGDLLERRGVPYEIACVDEGLEVPANLEDVAGLVFMGGFMSANDDLGWITQELELIRRAVARDLPVLGVCLGGQLMCKALGGIVSRGKRGPEIGWHDVFACNNVDAVIAGRWLSGLPERFQAFHWHGDTFTLPDGASLLLSSDCYPNQAFALGNSLATQFHLEMQPHMIDEWLRLYENELDRRFPAIQPAADIRAQLEKRLAALHQVADTLYGHWIDGLSADA
jgi:GMP synthase-like glutamine amidotransferase